MRRISIFVMALLATFGLAVSAAGAAANPHTIGQPTVTISDTGDLSVRWKVAGLGNFTSNAFLTADRVEATYGCDNPGVGGDGIQVPPGQPIVHNDVTGPTTTIPPSNGNITFTVGIPAPPAPDASDVCPGANWDLLLVSITYVNVVLHIQQGGVDVLTVSLGTFSRTFFEL
jgi:hypothetical protein